MTSKSFIPYILLFSILIIPALILVSIKKQQIISSPDQSQIFIPATEPTPGPLSFSPDDWETYTSTNGTFSFRYPNIGTPTQRLVPVEPGVAYFILSEKFNFDPQKISLCVTYKEEICMIPGKQQYQEDNVAQITLQGKKARSFFLSVLDTDGGINVLRVVQVTDTPRVEIARSIDGMGLAGEFQQILSTFRFAGPMSDWKTQLMRDGTTFSYPKEAEFHLTSYDTSEPSLDQSSSVLYQDVQFFVNLRRRTEDSFINQIEKQNRECDQNSSDVGSAYCDLVSEKKSFTLNGKRGFQYAMLTMSGKYTIYVFESSINPEVYIQISTQNLNPENKDGDILLARMLQSVRF